MNRFSRRIAALAWLASDCGLKPVRIDSRWLGRQPKHRHRTQRAARSLIAGGFLSRIDGKVAATGSLALLCSSTATINGRGGRVIAKAVRLAYADDQTRIRRIVRREQRNAVRWPFAAAVRELELQEVAERRAKRKARRK